MPRFPARRAQKNNVFAGAILILGAGVIIIVGVRLKRRRMAI